MRSLVAGIVGGISGGGAVLMAVVLLSIEGRGTVDRASALAPERPFVAREDTVRAPPPQPAIDTALTVQASAIDPIQGAAPNEWIMPAALVEEIQHQPIDPSRTVDPVVVAHDLVPADNTASLVVAAGSSNPEPSSSIAVPVLPDPPAARPAPASAVREPAELRALRSFRLSVPKELPKVDLAYPVELTATAASYTVVDAESPSRPAPTRATSTPSRQVGASVPSARMTAPAPRAAPVASSPDSATTAAATEVQSAQDSLMRASDAVKRLSRRMGGRYGR